MTVLDSGQTTNRRIAKIAKQISHLNRRKSKYSKKYDKRGSLLVASSALDPIVISVNSMSHSDDSPHSYHRFSLTYSYDLVSSLVPLHQFHAVRYSMEI